MGARYRRRREALFSHLPGEVDTVFLTPGETLRYFSGLNMHKSERPMLLGLHRDAPPAAVVPTLETGRVREVIGDETDFYVYDDATDPVEAARGAFDAYRAGSPTDGSVAVEFRSTRLMEHAVISGMVDWDRLVDAEDAVAALRSRKDDGEVERLRRAAEIIDAVLADVTEEIAPGVTEQEIARSLHKRVLDTEADRLGTLIVASGPNSAKPHTNTGTRELERGDPLIIDAGVVYEGYHSDITRTFLVGEESERIREIHEVVRDAAEAARTVVEPGLPFQAIDRAARRVVSEAGYGDEFPHRVGHGLGLEGHEPPYLVEGNEATLAPGHAVTVEPGVYVEGVGGARVEDDVVVTEDGAEVLTSSPRELRVV